MQCNEQIFSVQVIREMWVRDIQGLTLHSWAAHLALGSPFSLFHQALFLAEHVAKRTFQLIK